MAFELAEIDPTLGADQPAQPAGRARSSATATLMDPWEVVKWVAIFRLILPDALFRLCGGRVENLGELQPLAVKAGLNGVMMGNFLTTPRRRARRGSRDVRGARARTSRASPTTAPTRGPTTARAGSTASCPPTPIDELDRPARRRPTSAVGPVDAAAGASKEDGTAPRRARPLAERQPDDADAGVRRGLGRRAADDRTSPPRGASQGAGCYRRLRCVAGPQGRACCSTASRCCCCARTTTSGLADHPRVREAAADAALRYGAGAGASRLVSGNDDARTAAWRSGWPPSSGPRPRSCSARATWPTSGAIVGARRRGRRWSFSDEPQPRVASSTAAGCRAPRRSSTATATSSTSTLGPAPGRGPRGADRHRRRVLDGRRRARRSRSSSSLARRHGCRLMVDEAHAHRLRWAPADAARSPRRALDGEVDVVVGTLGKALGAVRRLRAAQPEIAELPGQHRALVHLLHRPCRRPSVGAALAALELLARAAANGSRQPAAQRATRMRRRARAAAGFDVGGLRARQIVPLVDRRGAARRWRRLRARARARRLRPGDPAADGARGDLAPAPHGDGLAHQRPRGRRRARARALRPRWRRGGGVLASAARGPGAQGPPRRSSARPRARGRSRCAGVFVTGTDTGRREDRSLAAAIARRCVAEGARCRRVFKPAVTGLDEPEDGRAADHELAAPRPPARVRPPSEVAPYRFGPAGLARTWPPSWPASDARLPRQAARGCAAAERADALVVEGVGGLLVPLTPGYLVRDLAGRPRPAGA